jgi:hypothetical protein
MPAQILLFLTLILLKHFIVDWVIQTDEMANEKGNKPTLLFLHGLEHAIGTLIIVLFFISPVKALMLVTMEMLIHCAIDFIKSRIMSSTKWKFPQKDFLISMGFDQFLHQVTYIALAYYIFIQR